MFSTAVGYKLIASDLTAALERTASQPNVERDSAYYLANITSIKSVDDFIGNDRIFKYAMKAFGLEDMDYAKAFMRKMLNEGIDDPRELRQFAHRSRGIASSPKPSISSVTRR